VSQEYQIALHPMYFSNPKCTKTRFQLGLRHRPH